MYRSLGIDTKKVPGIFLDRTICRVYTRVQYTVPQQLKFSFLYHK